MSIAVTVDLSATNNFPAKPLIKVERFPTRYKTSLKVTIFSNLLPSSPSAHNEVKIIQPSSPILDHRFEPTQPSMTSPHPHAH
jgi:hypothetical protein